MGYGGRVSMLDGGLPAWKAEGRAVTADKPAFAKGSVTVRPQSNVVVDRAYVFENLHTPSVHILDARDPQFYEGRNEPNPMSVRPGHILSANSIPYSSLTGELNRFKDRTVLDSMFRVAGAKPGERVVTYCHIGMQGSLLYFAARMLGYDASLYDGSYEEWSNRPELPIVANAKTEAKAARPQ
jgi:thiosulfate/3-mercaptopyruvate sulfurtransferase